MTPPEKVPGAKAYAWVDDTDLYRGKKLRVRPIVDCDWGKKPRSAGVALNFTLPAVPRFAPLRFEVVLPIEALTQLLGVAPYGDEEPKDDGLGDDCTFCFPRDESRHDYLDDLDLDPDDGIGCSCPDCL